MNDKISDISILIAEDEDDLREYFVEYLQLFFSKVYSASNGLEALTLYLSKKPQIVIADINMPNIDGLSLIKKIRDRDEKCKIIITSAHSDQDKLLQAIELNLVRYFIKPVNSDELKSLLLEVVDDLRAKESVLYFSEGYSFNKENSTLFVDAVEVHLKEKERQLLALFCSKVNRVLSAEDIYNHLFYNQPHKEFSSNAITSLMKRLRTKIPKELIVNQYGAGYKMVHKK